MKITLITDNIPDFINDFVLINSSHCLVRIANFPGQCIIALIFTRLKFIIFSRKVRDTYQVYWGFNIPMRRRCYYGKNPKNPVFVGKLPTVSSNPFSHRHG